MGKGGYIGVEKNLSDGNQRSQAFGVWSIGEVHRESLDQNWRFSPLELTNFTTDTGNTHTYPTNISAGDLILAVSSKKSTSFGNVGTFPSGFIEIARQDGSSNPPKTVVAYKIADGTESGTFSLSSDCNIVMLFKDIKPDGAGEKRSQTSSNINMTIVTKKTGLLIGIIAMDSSFTVINYDGMTLSASNTSVSSPQIRILTQSSEKNIFYDKNITVSASPTLDSFAILLNAY